MTAHLPAARPLRYLITDGSLTPSNFKSKSLELKELLERAVAAGVEMVQIREKNITARQLFELTSSVTRIPRLFAPEGRDVDTKVLVNDRADIAAAAGADGVHLTTSSLTVNTIRSAFGPDMIVGVSTHEMEEVLGAKGAGADFAVFGPIFETPGKEGMKGIEELKRVCGAAGAFPVIALGGIDETNFMKAVDAGAAGYAAIRMFARQFGAL